MILVCLQLVLLRSRERLWERDHRPIHHTVRFPRTQRPFGGSNGKAGLRLNVIEVTSVLFMIGATICLALWAMGAPD
ncbi:hypothetical protein C7G41_28860 [Bradyrhizobium sp. MOS002]|nr:hypothetical protein C7G41_28860 [Bradyrhizobium sp. MOS002]